MTLSKIALLALVVGIAYVISSGGGSNAFAVTATVVYFVGGLVLYFSPAWVAASRNHRNVTSIALLNLLLGWTVLGWVGALIWACSTEAESRPTQPTVSQNVAGRKVEPSWSAGAAADVKQCPFCAEDVKVAAVKCKHCGSDLSGLPMPGLHANS